MIKNIKFKFKKVHLILIAILLIGLFFRSYQIVERFEYAHDQDLYSWIVKDIVVNHHIRLIGQLTSAKGIFIGPLFYYSLIPFFLMFNMDPIGTLIPNLILGLVTILSFYIVFSKLFNSTIGLIAAFLDSVLLSIIELDRRVVPSTPTNIWMVWYFYVIINLARGNFTVLPLLGLLVGLIWNIHIALAPSLLAVPVALIMSRKFPSIKQIAIFFLIVFITSIPLLTFEAKHNFSQTHSFFYNLTIDQGGGKGLSKLQLLTIKANLNIIRLFFDPLNFSFLNQIYFIPLILLSVFFLIKKKLISLKEYAPLVAWIIGVWGFFTFSSTIISEYYLQNYEVVFIMIASFWLYLVYKLPKLGKLLLFGIIGLILIKNVYYFVTTPYYNKGYLERKSVAEYITDDSRRRGLPCVSVSYITTPGENVGFRYFFYLDNLHVNQSKSGSPDYTIVLPDELAVGAIDHKFGHIGVIDPKNIPSPEVVSQSCSGQNSNLTDPMFGYTE